MATVTEGPAPFDLKIVRGDTFEFFFRLYDQVYDAVNDVFIKGSPIDLTGYTFKAQIRADEKSATALTIELTATPGDQADLTNGIGYVLLSLTPAQTAGLGAADLDGKTYVKFGVWDCEVTEPGGKVTTIWAGDALIRPDVTRAP